MDCSKTIDFFAEAKRFCDSRNVCMSDATDKEQCPLYDFCGLPHSRVCANDAIMAMEALQKLSNEHPVKTYAQDFFEKFPKAQSNSDGTPFVCRKRIYGGIRSTLEDCDYTGACYRCWSEPLNDE